MINGKTIAVVMPAYNASETLVKTYNEIDRSVVDFVILVDDKSKDNTAELAKQIGIEHVIVHEKNTGYGGNQKSCYKKALQENADIVIMLHPDYQYTPTLILPMSHIIANNVYPVVLGSRILGNGALRGGMPMYKYIANRGLTLFQNLCSGQKLSEYHTGYRAFSAEVLRKVNFEINSDDFVFDNQMLSQIIFENFEIAEITCPTKYFKEASSINLRRSITYGFGVLRVSIMHLLARTSIYTYRILSEKKHKQV